MRNRMFAFNSELVESEAANDVHCLCLQVHEDYLNDANANEGPDVMEPGNQGIVSSIGDENLDTAIVTLDPETKELAETSVLKFIREEYSVVEAVHVEMDLPVFGVAVAGDVDESMISGIKAAADEVVVVKEIVSLDKVFEKIVGDEEDLIQLDNHMRHRTSIETDDTEMNQIGGEMDVSGLENDVVKTAVLNGNQEISTRENNVEEKMKVVMEDGVNGGSDQTKGDTAGHTLDLKENHSLEHTSQAYEHLEYGRVYERRDSDESNVIYDKFADPGSFAAVSGISQMTGSRGVDTWYQQLVVESFTWYLKSILGHGIIYSREAREICLNGYTNGHYGDDMNMRSTNNHVFQGVEVEFGASNKQLLAIFNDSEFLAAIYYAVYCSWLRMIHEDMRRHKRFKVGTGILCDDSSKLSKNDGTHKGSTHVRLRFHFMSVLAKERMVKLNNYRENEETDSIVIVNLEIFSGKLYGELGACELTKFLETYVKVIHFCKVMKLSVVAAKDLKLLVLICCYCKVPTLRTGDSQRKLGVYEAIGTSLEL
ncbi:unnamed protein product [Linum trigynum]